MVANSQLQGKKWPNSESVKRCRFCYAKIQGDPNSSNLNSTAAGAATPGVAGTSTAAAASGTAVSTGSTDAAESVKEG